MIRVTSALLALTLASGVACAKDAPKAPAAAAAKAPSSFAEKPAPGTKARCPVTGEEFTVTDKTVVVSHAGRFYAFCCPGCKGDFQKDPGKYAGK